MTKLMSSGDGISDLIRTGNEQGLLLSDWPRWHQFRDMKRGWRDRAHPHAAACAAQ